ncbi:uncharacterized protein BO96DRAFT_8822 [Aspergillus niger CBS 101883]|uniref:uncharacterized protein n=1 Tax=Aspergillus lacticoffeatus (strain CBS 101883) TaxID=1450533 RepID=UPI000D7F1A33|nr:uncharacterized protein BO96DRAFT_8822 [Aspergillus niger CBS 101883]PYH62168.1 hypothetical protein BO96DRAFT_8822 [Aspergillus niger CBS 101883]
MTIRLRQYWRTPHGQARSPCRDITTQMVKLITHLHRKAAFCRCKAGWRWLNLPVRVGQELKAVNHSELFTMANHGCREPMNPWRQIEAVDWVALVNPETPVEAGYSAHELPFWSTMGR